MISVLLASSQQGRIPARGPAVGLFADQEIKLIKGPLFVDEPYEIEREVVALSGSRRTESMWVRSTVESNFFGSSRLIAMAVPYCAVSSLPSPGS